MYWLLKEVIGINGEKNPTIQQVGDIAMQEWILLWT